MNEALLDTNVFIHAFTSDAHAAECLALLDGLQQGTIQARLELIVMHEVTFVLPRVVKQFTRQDVANYLLTVLGWPGVIADQAYCIDVLEQWRDTQGLSFADACLAQRAKRDSCEVYTKNVRELRALGVAVTDPLPGTVQGTT